MKIRLFTSVVAARRASAAQTIARLAVAATTLTHAGAIAAPDCLVEDGPTAQPVTAVAAGCFIKRGEKLLLVRQRGSGKLGFPAGYVDSGESAPCAAHRETWEEAGVEVIVGAALKSFGNGFILYRCRLLNGQGDGDRPLPVPVTGRAEIGAVLWLDPGSIEQHDWRFPWQWPAVIELYQRPD